MYKILLENVIYISSSFFVSKPLHLETQNLALNI
jgi:hypothetical protein